jgi:lipoprotein-anchoring transpeptidase ErfK/SrfK
MNHRCTRILIGIALFLSVAISADAAKKLRADTQRRDELVRLQIFLDNANFGPGKIDGRDGVFLRKALANYREAQGQPSAEPAKGHSAIDTAGLYLSSVDPIYIEYEVTKEDAASVGELPSGPVAQSKVKQLPYATLLEAVAEKFHADIDFIKELNKAKTGGLKEGSKLMVPNVKPFELSAVKNLSPGSEAKTVTANELGESTTEKGGEASKEKKEGSGIAVHVSTKESILEVRAGEKLVAAFPVTVGSHQTVSPVGKWTVQSVAKLPNFRYDLKMLKEGERSGNFHLLPPGPNNPVGIVWIALNKKGIGIHGTNDPDSIGRSSSHGCIRLANWDVVKVAELVKRGVPVTIE